MLKNFNNKTNNDNNLKMMSISATILLVLFIYTLFKSDNAMAGGTYYAGMIFLFILVALAFTLQKYKSKIQKYIPKNKFQEQLEKSVSTHENTNTSTTSTIEPVVSSVTFKDVAGIDEIKEELEEIVDFLNNPKKYMKYNVKLPKGVLLVGPPGVGKTLIAKAVAGEADVPFFYQSGASFVHIYVGMGAKRVRELFEQAKATAPSIIFIDEIDAVGKSRGMGSNDEREATLNELLTQMDGFDENNGVMVIAATNKIEVLDEALLRAGRFDRRVFLTLPNKQDRSKILELYLKGTKYSFSLDNLVNDTSGFSSSALATLVNESLLYMIKRDGKSIVEEDIEQAKQKIQFGKKQIKLLTSSQKEILATYQAGKAFITKNKVCLFDCDITNDDLVYPSKTQLENKIRKYLAGTITLEVIKNEVYAVSVEEIKEAYKIAEDMVEVYKMGEDTQRIIDKIKVELRTEISTNIVEIQEIKDTLLKDEIFVF